MTDLQKALNEAMGDLEVGFIKGYSVKRYDGVFHGYTLTIFFDDDDSENFNFSPEGTEIF